MADRVLRPSDYDPGVRLAVTRADSGDMGVLILGGSDVTFATSGGHSPETRRALRGLLYAMQRDASTDGGRREFEPRRISTDERAALEEFVRDTLRFDGTAPVSAVVADGLDAIFAEAERLGLLRLNADPP